MQVRGLNHINIITGDLAGTIAFYDGVLGMKPQAMPVPIEGFRGSWIVDVNGHPIVHVQDHNPARHGELKTGLTGALDHIALTCSGFEDIQQRCDALGVPYRVNDRQFGPLRQVFVTDPNGVVLELNFPEE